LDFLWASLVLRLSVWDLNRHFGASTAVVLLSFPHHSMPEHMLYWVLQADIAMQLRSDENDCAVSMAKEQSS